MTWTWLVIALAVLALAAWLAMRLRRHPKRRADGRVALAVPVRLRMGGREFEAMTADISPEGICLVGEVRTSAGQPVELQLALPGRQPVTVHGVVRWVERGRFGLLFDLQDRRRIALGEWLAEQAAAARD